MKKQQLTVDGGVYTICLPHADSDYIQEKIASTQTPYELDMLRDMASRLKPGDLVLDVGANIGNHSLYLACAVGAQVEAFEPNSELCEALRMSAILNGIGQRLIVHQVGVSDVPGFAHFDHFDKSNLGAQSLAVSLEQDEITLVTLDQFNRISKVRMVKVDVEGMEVRVLRGAAELLTKDRPILYIEAQNETDFIAINQILEVFGYLYCSTFNATPTHLFVHESEFQQISELGRYLTDKVLHTYQLNNSLKQTRQQLASANQKYRELNEQVSIIKQRAEVASLKYRDATSQISFLKNDLAKLDISLAQQSLQHEHAEIQWLRSKDLYESQIVQLKQEMESTKKILKHTRNLQSEAQGSLAALRASSTYKAGQYLRAATSSFSDALKLPIRLWRLRNTNQINQTKNNLVKVPSATESQSLDVSAKDSPPSQKIKLFDRAALLTSILEEKKSKDIRVACIMDDFTFGSYQPECDLYQLTPSNWLAELEECKPELLFIESAWRGKDELWGSKVGHCGQELQGIVAWCHERNIPTIFWNKEDPVHFETFLNAAKLFDFVFTTDMDCIHRYKAALGHARVYFLPFACQPMVHNPIEKYSRKDAFCFAGAYYVRYPERTRDLESFVHELPSYRPLEIYDRNFGKDDPNYRFPEEYQPYIVGTLPFSEIDKAYKGYRYAINLNSIKQSQTMFARRVYELLGSNTLTISNYSRGLRLMFGDLVITSDSGTDIKRRLEKLNHEDVIDRLRLAGLRKVMAEHTYADRISYILQQVTEKQRESLLPSFSVIAIADNMDDVRSIVASINRQQGVNLKLFLMVNESLVLTQIEGVLQGVKTPYKVHTISSRQGMKLLEVVESEQDWIAAMLPSDYYGQHYLLDIALATRYSSATVIGKAAIHTCKQLTNGELTIRLDNSSDIYRTVTSLYARCSAISPVAAQNINADAWLQNLAGWQYDLTEQLGIDPFNYCQNVVPEALLLAQSYVDDVHFDSGVDLQTLTNLAEKIKPIEKIEKQVPNLNGNQLVQLLVGKGFNTDSSTATLLPDTPVKLTRKTAIRSQIIGATLDIESALADGSHEYLYATKDIDVQEITSIVGAERGIPIHFEVEPGLNISFVILFIDKNKQRINSQIIQPNKNEQFNIPEGTAFFRFGLRVYASGSTRIKRLLFAHLSLEPSSILGQSDILLLTNHYPSYDDLYRNGFVHSRVKAYAERGIPVDVFRLRKDEPISWHEFQDVDVTTGSQNALRNMLESGRYKHVLVHFLDPNMWDVLKDFIDDINVTVWVHGAEVQPWWRREYNYDDQIALTKAKEESEIRLAFWKSIFSNMPKNLKFIFVSRYFADEVMEDVGVILQDQQYKIIHNPIDTGIFNYVPKDAEQRKKVLSIRPYASRKYANDLSVQAVLELSKESFFSELQFKFIGDGVLFDETLAPIKDFKNVSIERRFLSQQEIAAMHKQYGIFLCPTRMDAQGVSKDEAMSSGLVVVTNGVTAIPEFVDDECGVLASSENYTDMANGISMLYRSPDVFTLKSEKAAERVRRQTDKRLIVAEEIGLF